ncbi:hypothetical protein BKE38_13200 [Pseudoroseomonas deserti]|uniref:Phytanoyl-CoA dioxygenase n=2 Tax=Teichococcus deserti TaxID=1817963 RepID=A0A1V2H1L2_9PROT|nr:hypothetical protein BKE38_13200 [Pseudoroseomonas deserti]
MDDRHDLAGFAARGFALLPGAVDAALRQSLIDAVQRVQDSVPRLAPELRERLTLERDLPATHRDGIEAGSVGDAIFILGDPVAFDAVFWSVLRQPVITQAIRAALGGVEVAAHFMNVTIKQPGLGRRIGWHRDFANGYASPPRSCFLRAMLCLDGMTGAGGATQFIPGSHRLADEEASAAKPPRGWQPPPDDIVTVTCAPGDLVLIHPKVLHGGGMNRSARTRRNLILQAGDAAVPLRAPPALEAVLGHRLTES